MAMRIPPEKTCQHSARTFEFVARCELEHGLSLVGLFERSVRRHRDAQRLRRSLRLAPLRRWQEGTPPGRTYRVRCPRAVSFCGAFAPISPQGNGIHDPSGACW